MKKKAKVGKAVAKRMKAFFPGARTTALEMDVIAPRIRRKQAR
jgi:hypothetical protein